MNQSAPMPGMAVLQWITKAIAMSFNVALLIAAAYEVFKMFEGIYQGDIAIAIQEGLFALIILEMFYVVRSFIKYGKVNTGLIISVGIVAVVKELIFKLKTLEMTDAIGFSVLIFAMSVALYIEYHHYVVKNESSVLPRSIRKGEDKLHEETITDRVLAEDYL
jgi:uncharacterized membrane protein (DUF373 family)